MPSKKLGQEYSLPLKNQDFCKYEDSIDKTISYYNGENWDIPESELIEHNIFDVIVGYEDQNPITMRTIVSGQWKKGKDTMVLWHGYGGSGSLYYKIIQDL